MSAAIKRWIVALTVASLVMGFVLVHAAMAQEAVGQWHGTIAPPDGGPGLRLGLQIARGPDGKLAGFMTSPDQTEEKIPIEAIKLEGAQLSFTSEAIMGGYQANWDAGRGAWSGQWRQSGLGLPLVLEKGPVPAAKP